MRLITADDLVQAVTELSRGSNLPVRVAPIKSDPRLTVFKWCRDHGIDTKGPRHGKGRNYGAIENASLAEARGKQRLLKFRACANKRVAFALVTDSDRVRPAALAAGWVEIKWNGMWWV